MEGKTEEQQGDGSGNTPTAHPVPGSVEFHLPNYRLAKTLGIGSFGKVRQRVYR